MRRASRVLFAAVAAIAVVFGVAASVAAASDIPYGLEYNPESGTVQGVYPDRDGIFGQYVIDYCFFVMQSPNQTIVHSAMADIDSFSPWYVTHFASGCPGGHEDLVITEFDWDCDGKDDASPPNNVTPCSAQDQGGPAATAQCTAQIFGVCDKGLVKIDAIDVFVGTANEPGGYTAAHYEWNIKHLLIHEAGHLLGFKHSSAPGTCGPPGAYQWVSAFSAMGPDYPCTPGEAYTYPAERLTYNSTEQCNLDFWLVWGQNAQANC